MCHTKKNFTCLALYAGSVLAVFLSAARSRRYTYCLGQIVPETFDVLVKALAFFGGLPLDFFERGVSSRKEGGVSIFFFDVFLNCCLRTYSNFLSLYLLFFKSNRIISISSNDRSCAAGCQFKQRAYILIVFSFLR